MARGKRNSAVWTEPWRPGRLLVGAIAALLALAHVVPPAWAVRSDDVLEYEVKAAMLYNFMRFVEWPPAAWKDARAPMVVGVMGSDPFGTVLDRTLFDKSYGKRSIQIRRFHVPAEAEGCQVVFIARSERKHMGEILRALHAAKILTISDIEDFAAAGGAIGFVTVDKRIRFEINPASATRAGLTISSKLLRLAYVNDQRRGGPQP